MTTATSTTTRAGFSQVNLLPPENKERQATQRKVKVVALIGGAVVALLVLFSMVEQHKVSNLEGKISTQASANAALQAQVTKLQPYATLRESMIQREGLEHTAMANTVHWSSVLHDLSTILPSKVWLTSIAGTTAPSATPATTSTGQPSPVVGSLTFQCDSLDTDGLVQWLRALVSVKGWANAWVSSATKSAIGSTNVWQCASSVDLTQAALAGGGAR
jgi:type IV pilus assembly protein PilN